MRDEAEAQICRFARSRRMIAVLAIVASVLAVHSTLAVPAGAARARRAALGWLRTRPELMTFRLGRSIGQHHTVADSDGTPLYHVVQLRPAGFILVAADDELEPIIAFSETGAFDPDGADALPVLIRRDLPARMATVRGRRRPRKGRFARFSRQRRSMQRRWRRLAPDGLAAGDETLYGGSGYGSVSEVRVAPLVASRWSQGSAGGQYCYNYYTPNHYVCGCVATAMAQLMRHHTYPTEGVGTQTFSVHVDGDRQLRALRGGDGNGGPYDWHNMPHQPSYGMTDAQRRAIGALCHDAGVAVYMQYAAGGSGASMNQAAYALRSTFRYANAVCASSYSSGLGEELAHMINANLDAGAPVLLGISESGAAVGHAIVCDGYGFDGGSLYHHLNMGWAGADDAWYNLPDVQGIYTFDTVNACIYNIDAEAGGEIVSGRVLDPDGQPVGGVTVTATAGGQSYNGISAANGTYAIRRLPADTSYALTAAGAGFSFGTRSVTTGKSRDGAQTTGNRWGVDLQATGQSGCGTLTISATLGIASWTMTEWPDVYEGPLEGAGTLRETAPTGSYTVAFGNVPGWQAPEPMNAVVTPGCSVTIMGAYNGMPILGDTGAVIIGCNDPLSVTLQAWDPDGTVPALALQSGPEGVVVSDHGNGSATLAWTPLPSQLGSHDVVVTASDGRCTVTGTVAVEVRNVFPWPQGEITETRRPAFAWPAVDGAEWYCIWISRNGARYVSVWTEAADATWTPDFDLRGGAYRWWVCGWSRADGLGAWSDATDFRIPVRLPGAAEPLTPRDEHDGSGLVFSWSAADHASWYHVWVQREQSRYDAWWVEGDTSSPAPGHLPAGQYRWWVHAWNPDGRSEWSEAAPFTVRADVPLSVIPVAPTGVVAPGASLAYVWQHDPAAAWYQLYVAGPDGVLHDAWHAAAAGAETQTVTVPGHTPGDTYSWWVRGWSPDGYGPWNSGAVFSVAP